MNQKEGGDADFWGLFCRFFCRGLKNSPSQRHQIEAGIGL